MKKLYALLLILLTTQHLHAARSSCEPICCTNTCNDVNKTILIPRSPGVNQALEYTTGWRALLYNENREKWGGNLQGTFMYEQSSTTARTGRYFSPKHTACPNNVTSSPQECRPCPTGNSFSFGVRAGRTQTLSEDLNLRSFIQFPFGLNVPPSADEKALTMNLELERQVCGFFLNYHHNFDRWVKRSFIKLNLPVVEIEHEVDCCIKAFDVTFGSASNFFTANTLVTSVENYFSGNEVHVNSCSSTDLVLQEKLDVGLIPCNRSKCGPKDGKDRSRVSTRKGGVADIDLQLGYYLVSKPHCRASIALGITFPTGNKPDAKRIWSPVVGNGGHWGIGFNTYIDGKVAGNYDENLYIMVGVSYRYLIENEQCRILGLCGQQWGHYRLLGQKGQDLLVPAANKLLQRVKVVGGSHVDGILQFNYNNRGFGIDVGYNIFFKEQENIRLKKNYCVFTPNTYALPSKDFISTICSPTNGHVFGQSGQDFESAQLDDYLSNKDVDKTVAQTPALITHKLYGGFSYLWKWNIPVLIGLGSHYEWGSENEIFESWGIDIKLGVAF